jgi:hypothetical protein
VTEPTVVEITDSEFTLAQRLAEQTLEIFASKGGYYTNNLNSHLRGKCGEVAVSRLLRSHGAAVEDHWMDLALMSAADLTLQGSIRVDVKTWDERYWVEMGRCIAVGQLPTLRIKADVIVWCHSESLLRPCMNIVVVGWSNASEIDLAPRRMTGPASGRQVDNYQLDVSSLHPISELVALALSS